MLVPQQGPCEVELSVFSARVWQWRILGQAVPLGGRALTGPGVSPTTCANVSTVKRTGYISVLFLGHLKGSWASHLGTVDYTLRITVLEE